MQNYIMFYWAIGVMFVVCYQIIGIIYTYSIGSKYIAPEKRPPYLIIILSNLILTIVYPFFIVLLIVLSYSVSQDNRRQQKQLNEIKERLKLLDEELENKSNAD
jgi:hypothetical protein